MMDLWITITDENDTVLRQINLYADGSDSEETKKIGNVIAGMYPYNVTGDWTYAVRRPMYSLGEENES